MSSLIDWKTFDEKTPKDSEYRGELVALCLSELNRLIPLLQVGIEDQSMRETADIFHALKGRCSYFYSLEIGDAARTNEYAASVGDWGTVIDAMPGFYQLLQQFIDELEAFTEEVD